MNKAFSCLLVTLVLLGSSAVWAEEAKQATTKYAVLVGIDTYADDAIKPRKHAEADIQALYTLFTNPKVGGIPKENVRLLLGKPAGDGKKATREAFLDALKWVGETAKPEDQVVFAFLGNGGPLGDSGDRRCYFLADSTFKGRDKDAVSPEEIEEKFKALKARNVCVLLDVDFTAIKEDKSIAIAEPTLGRAPYREFLGDDGTDDHLPLAGRIAFLATNGLSASLDLDNHGLFATVLIEALGGKADKEGYEADGLITVDEVARYMNERLPKLAREKGKTQKEKDQEHFILSGPRTHFVLASNPEAAEKRAERLAKLERLIEKKTLPEELVNEARSLLERMPLLKKRQELRKAYQAFVDEPNLETLQAKRAEILKAMEMRRTEALGFARKVMEAIDIVSKEYVKQVKPGQLAEWAVRELYSTIEEPLPPAIEEKLKTAVDAKEGALLLLIAEARQALGIREDLDNLKDLTITLQRALGKLDPHTTYFDPETTEKMRKDIESRFTGIGVQIRKDLATDQLLVVTPIKGSPAYKAGIWAGDIVTRIKREVDSFGKPLTDPKDKDIPTKGMTVNAAVKVIQGQAGSKVVLTIKREGREEEFDVPIIRGEIEVESVLGAKRKEDDDWDYLIDHENKIGYIRLTSFARTSARDVQRVMKELVEKEKIKGFVLDLRFNPGGLLDAANQITDLFIGDGTIVSIRPRPDEAGRIRERKFKGQWEGSLLGFPMVCLINGYSASGSEIVSAALQDHERARIFGERSYGKGSVQNLLDFDIYDPQTFKTLKAEIKLTTATFWRPSGKNLNKASTSGKEEDTWGVTPDTVIKLSAKERRDLAEYQRNLETIERPDRRGKEKNDFKDRQLEAALQYLRGQIKLAAKVSPNRDDG
ncbi:MAG: S41 family peptidase [Gemmataceae bacterium]